MNTNMQGQSPFPKIEATRQELAEARTRMSTGNRSIYRFLSRLLGIGKPSIQPTTEPRPEPRSEPGKWGDLIIEADSVRDRIESQIQGLWYGPEWYLMHRCPVLFEITSDAYDHSLELHVAFATTRDEVESFANKCITREFLDFMAEGGIVLFWINFYEEEERSKKFFEVAVEHSWVTLNDCSKAEGFRPLFVVAGRNH